MKIKAQLKLVIVFSISFLCSEILGAEPALDSIKEGLIQVRTYDGDSVISHGTGFFVSDDGKFATNFHVIRDAIQSGLTLKLCQKDITEDLLDVDVWSVWPERDLALLYVKSSPSKKFKALKLSDMQAKSGQLAWALGYPMSSEVKSTVTRGSISAIRTIADIEALANGNSDLARNSSWLQMDVAINPGNSGGPVVDENGSVIGISTMTRLNTQAMNFAIDVSSVKKLLTNPTTRPVGIDGVVVMPEVKIRKSVNPKDRGSASDKDRVLTIPKFEIKPIAYEQKAKPQTITDAANVFKNAVKKVCPLCGGKTYVETKTHYGDLNPANDRTVTSKSKCKSCDRGFITAKPEVVNRTAVNLLKLLPSIVPETKDNELVRTKALDQVAASFLIDMEWSDVFQKMCLRNMQKDKIASDSVIAAQGYVLGSTLYGNTKRYIIWVSDTDLLFLVDRPIDHDRATDLNKVVFGGLVTSSIDTKSGRVLIVQGGFVRTYSKLSQMLKE